MMNTMGNELVLSEDINVITAEINAYQRMAGEAIFEIGKRLKHVKENDLVHGEWSKWCENVIGLTQDMSRRYVKVYEEFGEGEHESVRGLGIAALYQIATMPEEERTKEHTISSTGESKTVDEMTVRELREVKKKLKEKEEYEKILEEENNKLTSQLQQEKNKPVQVERVEIERVVEVDRTDYSKLQQLQSQLESLQKKNSLADREINLLKNKLQDEQNDADAYRKAKDELEKLYQTKDDLSRQIESATSISGLVVDIEHLLQNKLAPVKYSKAIYEQQDNPVVVENLKEIVERVNDWCNEMRGLLPRENGNRRVIIDGQEVESQLI